MGYCKKFQDVPVRPSKLPLSATIAALALTLSGCYSVFDYKDPYADPENCADKAYCAAAMKRVENYMALKQLLRDSGYEYQAAEGNDRNDTDSVALSDGDHIYAATPTGGRDYSKPGYVVKGDMLYPTTPEGFRNYSKPGFKIDRK